MTKTATDSRNVEHVPSSKRPVAWRVYDGTGHWIIFQDEETAWKVSEANGTKVQGLYVRDGT